MRPVIIAAVIALILLFGFLAVQLTRQVIQLSTSSIDNIQWSLSQLEVELGHYTSSLHETAAQVQFQSDQTQSPEPDFAKPRLRLDLLHSRLGLVRHGQVARELAIAPKFGELLSQIDQALQEADDIFALANASVLADLPILIAQAESLHPLFRELALLGVNRFSQKQETDRATFARQLELAGGLALVLLLVLSGMLFYVDRLLQRAERSDKAKSMFMAIMTHEMRTPINGILGVLDLLKSSKLSPAQDQHVQIATASSENLLDHVNQALDITQIEAGELSLHETEMPLASVFQNVVSQLKPLAIENQMSLTLNLETDVDGIYAFDANRLRQILTNLIGNAIKFTNSGSVHVWVGASFGTAPEGNNLPKGVQIQIRDTGIGIHKHDLSSIFEDFVTLDASFERQNSGAGLGLAITKRIVTAMKGSINVESVVGAGTVFTLNLPIARVAALREPAPRSDEKFDQSLKRQLRVLMVEDNGVNRLVLREMLERIGHLVFEARSGQEAIQMTSGQRYDLIIMDVSMPGIDGIAATQRIREAKLANFDTPIIGLTAHNIATVHELALAAGMDRVLVKPLRLNVLRDILYTFSDAKSLAPGPFEPTAQPTQKPNPEHTPILDTEILTELLDVLGQKRMDQSILRFLAQCEAGLKAISLALAEKDWNGLADTAHKLSGASALLGCKALHLHFAELNERAVDTQTGKKHAARQVSELVGQIAAKYTKTQHDLVDWKANHFSMANLSHADR